MSVFFGMTQTDDGVMYLFSSHRPPSQPLSIAATSTSSGTSSTHSNLLSDLSGKGKAPGGIDKQLDLHRMRDSLVRYCSVTFVCRNHMAAILGTHPTSERVTTNRCICNFMGQPRHLCVNADYRKQSSLLGGGTAGAVGGGGSETDMQNVMLSEIGILPTNAKEAPKTLDLTNCLLSSPKGRRMMLGGGIDVTHLIKVNTHSRMDKTVYIYTDTAPRELSLNAFCIMTRILMTDTYVVLAAEHFTTQSVDKEKRSNDRAVAKQLVNVISLLTTLYDGYFDEIVLAIELNSYRLDGLVCEFEDMFYSNVVLATTVGVSFVTTMKVNKNKTLQKVVRDEKVKYKKRIDREYNNLIHQTVAMRPRKSYDMECNQLLTNEPGFVNDNESEDDDGSTATNDGMYHIVVGRERRVLKRKRDGSAEQINTGITLTIGYLMTKEKVAIVQDFFADYYNLGNIRCAKHLISLSIQWSVPEEIVAQLENTRILRDKRTGSYKVTGKTSSHQDDLAVCVYMSHKINLDISRGKGPVLVKMKPRKAHLLHNNLHDPTYGLSNSIGKANNTSCANNSAWANTHSTSSIMDPSEFILSPSLLWHM